jgi:hypothetical protein
MDPTIQINQPVDIVTIYHAHGTETTLCVPWKMKYGIHEVIFKQFGMRHATAKGKRMIHVFEMSDGVNDYRIEFDAERLTWQLISMMEGQYVGK